MRLTSVTAALALAGPLLAACQTAQAAKSSPAGIEVFIKGSDIETPENVTTRSLRDALEAMIRSRADMALSQAGSGDLTVLIPNLVTIDGSTGKVSFAAHLTRKRDGALRDVSGSCSRAALSECARTITDAVTTLEK
jgi:hypothetical protein